MYISQQFSGNDPPGHPLLVFSIRNRNKRLVNNQCTSLNEVKIIKIYYHSSYQVNVFYCQYLCHFVVACVHNESNTSSFVKKDFCQNDKLSTKLHTEFKNNSGDSSQTHWALHPNS